MGNFWAQILGGSITSIIGGLVGFFAAYAIHTKQRREQVEDAKRLRLLDAFAELHEVYTRLLPDASSEAELSDRAYQKADFVLTILLVEQPDLWKIHGNKFGSALSAAASDEFKSDEEREEAFSKFEDVLTDLLNDIQERLKIIQGTKGDCRGS